MPLFKLSKLDKKEGGFVILYAVMVVSVVAVISATLMIIVSNQIILSAISKNTKIAYYAALAAADCAEGMKSLDDGEYFTANDKSDLYCPEISRDSNPDNKISAYQIDFTDPTACADLTITFDDSAIPMKRKVESLGYNVACDQIANAGNRVVQATVRYDSL